MSELQPLCDEAIVAARLRQQARDLILLAEKLEANLGIEVYKPKGRVEYTYSPQRMANEKPSRRRKV